MAMYYNGKKVRNLYYNGKCITRLALGKEMTRLVEGDDFVRAEWLKGDGAAYIELDNQFNTDKDAFISAKFKQYSSRNNGFDIIIGKNNSMDGYCIRVSFSTVIFYDLHKVVNGVANSFRKTKSIDTEEHNVYMSFSNLIVDNVDTSIVWGEQFDASMNIKNTRIYSGYAKYKELSIRTNNKEFNLTPCRLLRPIPATLDGNGIARNADECGMYNSVNGLFYGNVGSGTFTVSDN